MRWTQTFLAPPYWQNVTFVAQYDVFKTILIETENKKACTFDTLVHIFVSKFFLKFTFHWCLFDFSRAWIWLCGKCAPIVKYKSLSLHTASQDFFHYLFTWIANKWLHICHLNLFSPFLIKTLCLCKMTGGNFLLEMTKCYEKTTCEKSIFDSENSL